MTRQAEELKKYCDNMSNVINTKLRVLLNTTEETDYFRGALSAVDGIRSSCSIINTPSDEIRLESYILNEIERFNNILIDYNLIRRKYNRNEYNKNKVDGRTYENTRLGWYYMRGALDIYTKALSYMIW